MHIGDAFAESARWAREKYPDVYARVDAIVASQGHPCALPSCEMWVETSHGHGKNRLYCSDICDAAAYKKRRIEQRRRNAA